MYSNAKSYNIDQIQNTWRKMELNLNKMGCHDSVNNFRYHYEKKKLNYYKNINKKIEFRNMYPRVE